MEFDRVSFRKALSHQLVNSGNGYTLTDNPEKSQYRMSVFVRNLEKTSPEAAAGLVVGLASTVANAYVQDVVYLLVADIQIKERAKKGVIVRRDSKVNTKISDDGASTQTYSEATNLKEYRTRVVTTANKANLELEEAQPLMFDKTAYAMSVFF